MITPLIKTIIFKVHPPDLNEFLPLFFLNNSPPRIWAFGPDPRRRLEKGSIFPFLKVVPVLTV